MKTKSSEQGFKVRISVTWLRAAISISIKLTELVKICFWVCLQLYFGWLLQLTDSIYLQNIFILFSLSFYFIYFLFSNASLDLTASSLSLLILKYEKSNTKFVSLFKHNPF